MLKSIEKRIRFVAYICYFFSLLSLLRLVGPFDFVNTVFAICIAGIWYQAGTGLLKQRSRSRIVAISIFSVFLLAFLFGVYLTVIYPMITPNVSGSGVGRWISLILLLVCAFSIKELLRKDAKEYFLASAS